MNLSKSKDTNQREIFLLSSNASPEYIADILEVIALPVGFIQNFRYQKKYVDPALSNLLPIKGNPLPVELKGINVNIYFLNQRFLNIGRKVSEWERIYPIRSANLIHAYKTGNDDRDIVHFVFELTNDVAFRFENARNFFGEDYGKIYASMQISQNLPDKKKNTFNTEVRKICDSFDMRHFITTDGEKFSPIFIFIDGIRKSNGEYIYPNYDTLTYKSYFKLKEGEKYVFDFHTFFSKEFTEFTISLNGDDKIFINGHNEFVANSRYDVKNWPLIVSSFERTCWGYLKFIAKGNNENQNKNDLKPLPVSISFLVKAVRQMALRFWEIFSDFLFALATSLIALSSVYKDIEKQQWWLLPTMLACYLYWLMIRFILKTWKG